MVPPPSIALENDHRKLCARALTINGNVLSTPKPKTTRVLEDELKAVSLPVIGVVAEDDLSSNV
jgi:hypothetical protein